MQHCILLNNQCLIDTNVSLFDLSGCEWNKLASQCAENGEKEGKDKLLLDNSACIYYRAVNGLN